MMKDLELLDLNQYFENLRKDAMKRIRQLEIAQNEPAIYELRNCDLDGWKIDEFIILGSIMITGAKRLS